MSFETDEIEEMLKFVTEEDPDNEFYRSLEEFYCDRDYLTPKQHKSLIKAYWEIKDG